MVINGNNTFTESIWTAQILFEVVWLSNSISPVTSDRNLMSPYTTAICGFFSPRKHTCRTRTTCPKQSYLLLCCTKDDFLHSWICMLCAFANGSLFTTHICSNEFIDQIRNPVTSGRREDIPSWKPVGSGSWFPGREGMMISRKRSIIFIRMIGTHSCFDAARVLPSFFSLSLKGE